MAVKPQEQPDDFHDASDHKYDPDEKWVCKKCGWWDPNGDTCPGCGKPLSEHIAIVLVISQGGRKNFISGTHFSTN